MKIEYLKNGKARLTAEGGIIDRRNGEWFSEAIVAKKNIKYFKKA